VNGRPVGRPTGGEDLRSTLVDTALQLLEESDNPAAITVASIVEAAGCTPPTLYHYWPTREALLLEASARGFELFRESQDRAIEGEPDPLRRIRLRGRSYLDFSLARPTLFRVLFLGRPLPGRPQTDTTQPGEGLRDLISDVSAAMDAGQFRRCDPLTVAIALWSAVHGIAALWASTEGAPDELATQIAEFQQDAIVAGLAP
jgi:AcrR family transcriptional regulator